MYSSWDWRWLAAALLVLAFAVAALPPADSGPTQPASVTAADLPLYFVPNDGQTGSSVRYEARGPGFGFSFMSDRAVLAFTGEGRGHALELGFIGANPNARLEADKSGAGTVNYLRGREHQTRLPTYRRLVYRGLWPGIDMVFLGSESRLRYEFLVRPGAKVSDIRLAYRGAEGLSLTQAGALMVHTSIGALRDAPPRSFQRIGGRVVPVDSRYALGRGNGYGFEVGAYRRDRPLVIDPELAYSTRFSASTEGIAVDSRGSAYLTGAASSSLPTTPGAFDPTSNAGFGEDAFVAKLSPDGSSLVYSTFLGGRFGDRGFDIALDAAGSAYVTGDTTSIAGDSTPSDFPTTPGAFDTQDNDSDAFVTKLSPDGSQLEYSTFLGGDTPTESGFGTDTGFGISVDEQGSAYVTGAAAEGFPTTPGAFDRDRAQVADSFLAKLNPSGSALVYSTFLSSAVYGSQEIAVDDEGNAYVAGEEIFNDVHTTPGSYDPLPPPRFESADDSFVVKLSADGSTLLYGTYLGGTGDDRARDIAVDGGGSAYVTGDTQSSNFPTTLGAFSSTHNGGSSDFFVTKLSPAGSSLDYSTYLGGSDFDNTGGGPMGLAVDGQGRAVVSSQTTSADFPTTPDAFDSSYNGGTDAFVTQFSPDGSSLQFSTYLGGSAGDRGVDVALDRTGDAYLTGRRSAGFPTTPGAFDTTTGFSFVTKVDLAPPGPPAELTLTPETATNLVGDEHCVTATVRDSIGSVRPDTVVVFSVEGANNSSGTQTTGPDGQATFCYAGALFGSDRIHAFADFDPVNGSQDTSEPGDEATKTWQPPATTPDCKALGSGRITAANGDRARFHVQVSSKNKKTKGRVDYLDLGPAEPFALRSAGVIAMTCDAGRTEAAIFGNATIPSVGPVSYRIDLRDVRQSGASRGTFRIRLGSGYDSGEQPLGSGSAKVL